jgi:hypothetical protein
MTFKIISRRLGATLDNPSRNLIEFDFVKDGQNFGGRKYDLTFWTESDAKEHFIKWCGY